MITLRWVAIMFAVICLVCLTYTPTGPATTWLAGFFIASFLVVCWTVSEKKESAADVED